MGLFEAQIRENADVFPISWARTLNTCLRLPLLFPRTNCQIPSLSLLFSFRRRRCKDSGKRRDNYLARKVSEFGRQKLLKPEKYFIFVHERRR